MKRKPFSATNQPPYTRTEAPIIHGRIIFFFFFSVSNSSQSWNVKRVRQPIWKPVHTLCIRLSNRPYRVASSNLPVTVGFLWWCWDWSYGIFVWFRLQPQEFQFISFHQFADVILLLLNEKTLSQLPENEQHSTSQCLSLAYQEILIRYGKISNWTEEETNTNTKAKWKEATNSHRLVLFLW